MRTQFLNRAGDRLSKVSAAVDELTANPSDQNKLSEVRGHLHWLAGAGGTYKLPDATEIGTAGEELCDSCLQANRAPSTSELHELKEMIERARSIILTALNSAS